MSTRVYWLRGTGAITAFALAVLLLLVIAPGHSSAVGGCGTSWAAAVSGDWQDNANWTSNAPSSGTIACITVSGTYTVRVPGSAGGQAANVLTLGGSSGTQTLQIEGTTSGGGAHQDASLQLNDDSVIGSNGVVVLTTTGTNAGSTQLSTAANKSISNSGVIQTLLGAGVGSSTTGSLQRLISADIGNPAGGSIQIKTDTDGPSSKTWSTAGTFTIDAGKTLTLSGGGGPTLSLTGGTLTNSGTLRIFGGSLNHTGGSLSGNNIRACGTALNIPGPGTMVVNLPYKLGAPTCGTNTLTGNVGASDTINLNSDATTAAGEVNILQLTADRTNNGTINMQGGSAGGDQLTGGKLLTNNGALNITGSGERTFDGALTNNSGKSVFIGTSACLCFNYTWTNNGDFTIGGSKRLTLSTGSFTQSGGTLTQDGTLLMTGSGTFTHSGGDITGNPVSLCGPNLDPAGPGSATFDVLYSGASASCTASGASLTGDIGADDTVNVTNDDTTAGHNDILSLTNDRTNNGTLKMTGAGTDQIIGGFKLTNAGTFQSVGGGAGATRLFQLAVTNSADKTMTFDDNLTDSSNLLWVNLGTINIAENKTLTVNGDFQQNGGELNINGTLSGGGTTSQTGGTTTVATGGIWDPAGPLTISDGTLKGTGSVVANVVNQGGTVHPGDSPGVINFDGSYSQDASSTLEIEIAGGQASALSVGGTATIAGTLAVTTTGVQSGTFQIIDAASRSGTFSPVTFTGQSYTVAYPSGGVLLVVPSSGSPPSVGAPEITSVTPSSGGGGTTVVIKGKNLDRTTQLMFGPNPATSYSIDGYEQLTAVAPAGTGTVDVRATNPDGTSAVSAGDQFTYPPGGGAGGGGNEGGGGQMTPPPNICDHVPNLKRHTLKGSRKLLDRAGCGNTLRRTNHAKHHPTKVKSQTPKAGDPLPEGQQVLVTVT